MENKIEDKKFKKKMKIYTIVSFVIIASGFTSFSNHPTWGYVWSASGLILLCTILFLKNKRKKSSKLSSN